MKKTVKYIATTTARGTRAYVKEGTARARRVGLRTIPAALFNGGRKWKGHSTYFGKNGVTRNIMYFG